MAPVHSVKNRKSDEASKVFAEQELPSRPGYRRLGLLNGLLIGLALALGLWGFEAVRLASLPIPLPFPAFILSSLSLVLLCGFAGWLSSHSGGAGRAFLIWLIVAAIIAVLIDYLPNYGRTLAVWLADRRFWGLQVYPVAADVTIGGLVLAGIFIILTLIVLALLQDYRLERVYSELGENEHLTAIAWFLLLLPLPLVAGAGFITNYIRTDATAAAVALVDKAIQTNLTHEGDLFQLGLEEGISYNALRGVRDQLSTVYSLRIGEVDQETVTTFVVAHFSNGAWINCRVINEQLSFCYDAAPPYTIGLESLITGSEVPEDCRGCLPQVEDELADWLQARGDRFDGRPEIYRLAQWGRYALMRAEAENGEFAIECWFEGVSQVRLQRCVEAGEQ